MKATAEAMVMASLVMMILVAYMVGWAHGARSIERVIQTERGRSCQVQDWPMPGEAKIGFIRCDYGGGG
jgi:hypothetical protein